MGPISLQGKLVASDVWFSEPDIGTAIFISGIEVPGALETRAFYEAQISISAGVEIFEFATDVGIEPAHTNAIGQKRERAIAFSTPRVLATRALAGADIRLTIKPQKKVGSEELARFKEAMGKKAKS